MEKHQDSVLVSSGGFMRPLAGALVYVRDHTTQELATLYSDNGISETSNPTTTDTAGFYSFYVLNGLYDITVTKSGFASVTKTAVEIVDETSLLSEAFDVSASYAAGSYGAAIKTLMQDVEALKTPAALTVQSVQGLSEALDSLAAKNSPLLTGTPTAASPSITAAGSEIATAAWVNTRIANELATYAAGGAPVNTVLPAVTFASPIVVGTVLTCSTGTWTGTSVSTFAYAWFRDGVAIGSATSSTYTVVSADLGTLLTCRVTATGSVSPAGVAFSIGTAIPAAATPVASDKPVISESLGSGGTALHFNPSGTADSYYTFPVPEVPSADWAITCEMRYLTDAAQTMISSAVHPGSGPGVLLGTDAGALVAGITQTGGTFKFLTTGASAFDGTDARLIVQRRSANYELYLVKRGDTATAPSGGRTTAHDGTTLPAATYSIGRNHEGADEYTVNPLGEVAIIIGESFSTAEVTSLAAGVPVTDIKPSAEIYLPLRDGAVATEVNLGALGAANNATKVGSNFTTATRFFESGAQHSLSTTSASWSITLANAFIQWFKNGVLIPGASQATLALADTDVGQSFVSRTGGTYGGQTYYVDSDPYVVPQAALPAGVTIHNGALPVDYSYGVDEYESADYTGTIAFGAGTGTWHLKTVTGPVMCSNETFGDPQPGAAKECWYLAGGTPTSPPTPPGASGLLATDSRWVVRLDATAALTAQDSLLVTQLSDTGSANNALLRNLPSSSPFCNATGQLHSDGSDWLVKTTGPDGGSAFKFRIRSGQPVFQGATLRSEVFSGFQSVTGAVQDGQEYWILHDVVFDDDCFGHSGGGLSLFDLHGQPGFSSYPASGLHGMALQVDGSREFRFITHAPDTGIYRRFDVTDGASSTVIGTPITGYGGASHGNATEWILDRNAQSNIHYRVAVNVRLASISSQSGFLKLYRKKGSAAHALVINESNTTNNGGGTGSWRFPKIGDYMFEVNFGSKPSRTTYRHRYGILRAAAGTPTLTDTVVMNWLQE